MNTSHDHDHSAYMKNLRLAQCEPFYKFEHSLTTGRIKQVEKNGTIPTFTTVGIWDFDKYGVMPYH